MALDIKPIEGMVALELLDEQKSDSASSSGSISTPPDYSETLYAIVVGIGPKGPAGVKKGDTVICRAYARDGARLDDDTVLVETYCILGVVSGK